MIVLVLLIAAAILAGLATFGIGRWNLHAAAFCCFVLSVLLPGLGVDGHVSSYLCPILT